MADRGARDLVGGRRPRGGPRAMIRAGWLLASLLLLGGGALAPAAHAQEAPEGEPWSTMRACVAVLDRFTACAGDDVFRSLRPKWVSLADPKKKVGPREIEALV